MRRDDVTRVTLYLQIDHMCHGGQTEQLTRTFICVRGSDTIGTKGESNLWLPGAGIRTRDRVRDRCPTVASFGVPRAPNEEW